jgi:hypothetical protein
LRVARDGSSSDRLWHKTIFGRDSRRTPGKVRGSCGGHGDILL